MIDVTAIVTAGKPHVAPEDRGRFADYMTQFIDGEEIRMRLTRKGKDATDPQRRFYRGVVVPIFAEFMGEPSDEYVHQVLAWRFLRIEDDQWGTPRRKSTAKGKMTDQEMSDYIDRLISWGTVEHGLRFPEPERDPARRAS
jgi:hypothetical protein